ncbi:heterokaryon incompatibility protein-domain-containing protein [Hypoxylon sp. NC1633]|nr:heterokaryon incompatibility protein-domain-containing protein [Hypoxylon sp. NC1633]
MARLQLGCLHAFKPQPYFNPIRIYHARVFRLFSISAKYAAENDGARSASTVPGRKGMFKDADIDTSHIVRTTISPFYNPLDPSKRQIRLLRITGVSEDGIVECSFHTASLDGDISFATLSYVWGDASITREICVNGRRRNVTRNLESALRQIRNYSANSDFHEEDSIDSGTVPGQSDTNEENRDEDYTAIIHNGARTGDRLRRRVGLGLLPLWVDAVCINQDDILERSHQVQLMREIYAKSFPVLSWIDSTESGSMDLALKTIRELAPACLQPSSDFDWYQHPELCDLAADVDSRFQNKYWNAIHDFEASEYFHRIWIFQELWVGRERTFFICNNECLPLVSLLVYGRWAFQLGENWTDQMPPPILNADLRYSLKLRIPKFLQLSVNIMVTFKDSVDFGDIITLFLDYQCKDPRDKVYGLLAVLPMEITPDYEKSVEDVFVDFITNSALDASPGTLLVLSGIGVHPRSNDRVLPSWVPDLELLGDQLTFNTYKLAEVAAVKPEIPIQFQPSMFKTKGITCFGIQVTDVSEVAIQALNELDDTDIAAYRAWLVILKYLAQNKSYLLSDVILNKCDRARDFIRTLVRVGPDDPAHVSGGSEPSNPIPLSRFDEFSTSSLFKRLLVNIGTAASEMEESEPDLVQSTLESLGFASKWDMWVIWEFFGVEYVVDDDDDGIDYLDLSLPASLFNQAIFHTSSGLVGIGPAGMVATDKVYLIHGLALPIILREVDGKFVNVGACYIQGISDEASLEILKEREKDVQEINIV